MSLSDVKALEVFLSRHGALNSANDDLIKNAIWSLEHGNEYRACDSLKGLASNLKNEGKSDLAQHVERLL